MTRDRTPVERAEALLDHAKAVERMEALLDQATAALEAGDVDHSLALVAKAREIADTLPKTKLVLQ